MALGFARDNNLAESIDSSSAAGILNNLGGVGIADDIRLFAGNLSTVLELNYGADGYTATNLPFSTPEAEIYSTGVPGSQLTYILIPIQVLGRKPYSNGTVIYTLDAATGAQVYHIVDDSNGVDRFRLYAYNKQTKTKGALRDWSSFYSLPVKKFFREEPVLFENIQNYSAERPNLNDETSGINNPFRNTVGNEEGALNAGRDFAKQLTFLKLQDPQNLRGGITNATDSLSYKQGRNLVAYKSNRFNRLIEFGGPVHITNDFNISLTSSDPNLPGLYIVGGGVAQRAFSDTNNPWEEATVTADTGGNMQAISTTAANQDAQVLNLIWEGSPVINLSGDGSSGNQPLEPSMTSVSANDLSTPFTVDDNWSHKAKVTINGEDYFLLLTDNTGNLG